MRVAAKGDGIFDRPLIAPSSAGSFSTAFRTRKKRPTTSATPRSSRESPTAMHSSGA